MPVQPTVSGFAPAVPPGRPAPTTTTQPAATALNEPARTAVTDPAVATATTISGEEQTTSAEPSSASISATPVAGPVVVLILIGGSLLVVGRIAGLSAWLQRLHRRTMSGLSRHT